MTSAKPAPMNPIVTHNAATSGATAAGDPGAPLPAWQDALAVLEQLAYCASPTPRRSSPGVSVEAQREDVPAAESQLQRAEARYRTLIEQIPAVTFMAALDGGMNELYVSPQIQTMLGFSQQEWLANPVLWYNQLHPDDQERWHVEFARTCALGEPFRADYRFIARDGHVVWVHGEAKVVRDASGRPLFLQGVAFDISESKRAEEQMHTVNVELERRVRERTAQLETANKELEAFSYSVSHDLRTPLRSIDGFSQALEEDFGDKLAAEGQDYLRRVRQAAQRMDQLIEGMLRLSRVTRSELDRQSVQATTLARQIADELAQNEPQRQVTFVIAEGIIMQADAQLARILLDNLIGNAWKYTARHSQARIEFGMTQSQGENVYFVKDDGAGFDMNYASKLFGAFQRLHTGAEFAGTGIGLATVQRIVHRHGGRIWAQSAVEQGATFFFTL